MRQLRRIGRDGRKYRDAADATLIEAMRRDDRWAWAEYFARFYPALEEYARRARIPREEWNSCIMDVLDDAALKFIADGAVLPRSLMHYLVVSVRHKFLNLERGEATRQAHYTEAATLAEEGEERIVRSVASEASLRASRGPMEEGTVLRRALRRLALVIVGRLTEREWELLSLLGERVPLARIAEWHGASYAAVAQRSSRLRSKLREVWPEHVASFPEDEHVALRRFFARIRRAEAGRRLTGRDDAGTGGDAA